MRTRNKIVTSLAAVGLVAAAGSAFTGTGVTTTGQAALPQFVGGTVSQAVTGATLDSVDYGFVGGNNVVVDRIVLKFTGTDAVGQQVAVAVTGGDDDTFTCADVVLAAPDATSTCNVVVATGDTDAGYTDVDSISITVS